jgi:hypothetical protein
LNTEDPPPKVAGIDGEVGVDEILMPLFQDVKRKVRGHEFFIFEKLFGS